MPFKKRRILQVMSGYGGGISAFLENKARALKTSDLVFDVVTFDHCPASFTSAIEAMGGQVYQLPNPKQAGWRRFFSAYHDVYVAHSYDVVHCHIAGYRMLVHWLMAKRQGVPAFYVHAHTAYVNLSAYRLRHLGLWLDQWLNRSLSRRPVGCSTEALATIFGAAFKRDESVLIPNSIAVRDFALTPSAQAEAAKLARQEFQLPVGKKLIAHIGRLKTVKNHRLTFQVAKAAKRAGLPWHFLVVGEGPLAETLSQQLKDEGLSAYVTLLGRVEPIAPLYPALNAIIMPSLAEGLPTVAVEAQASGVPVVLSDVITREVDLGLGLLTYQSLAASPAAWLQALEASLTQATVPAADRLEALDAKKFSNEASAELYRRFLKGELRSYQW